MLRGFLALSHSFTLIIVLVDHFEGRFGAICRKFVSPKLCSNCRKVRVVEHLGMTVLEGLAKLIMSEALNFTLFLH